MLHGMEDEALRSNGGNLSTMPLHMADIGTDTFDQDFTLGMAETERALLDEIDAALARIDNKSYGVCQLTGKPIPKARLDAKPWAKYTIEAAKLMERGMPSR
jgi:RNA polymerase-binding protein DksA